MSDTGNKGFYSAASYLGQDHRISNGILKETACMAIEERVLIADLEAIKKIFPLLDQIGDMDMKTLIDKIILPLIKNEGYAKWQRDVVTDMAIKKGESMPSDGWKKNKGHEKADDAVEGDDEP
jgi:hypothetical protein